MPILERIRKYFTPQILDITVNKVPFILPSTTNDAIALRLDEQLFTLVQIDTIRDNSLVTSEQIHWEMNSKLPQPIEHYVTAVTMYHEDEQTLQALGAAVEKELLEKILAFCHEQRQQIKEITSPDKQFVFYTARPTPYHLPVLLKKINITLGYGCLILAVVCGSILGWHMATAAKRQQQTQQTENELQALERTYARHQAVSAYKQKQTVHKQTVQHILRFLQQLRSTPDTVVLDEVIFGMDKNITVRGRAAREQDRERFGKILQKYSRKTMLLSSTRIGSTTSFEYVIPTAKQARSKPNADN